ncbi:hypothetical protein AAGS40_23315 [Paraburkholderia sp. PREW-6R]|uniref:hypothetical protein n=1 Tax=Paraburkholderia sp. PREW-6R TaxID=3141544 RepID=UPI0031F568DB
MSIVNTLINLAALGILRRLRKLERTSRYDLEYVAPTNGAQVVAVPPDARSIALSVNGLSQSDSAFEAGPGFVSIPADTCIVAGDFLTITYWK